MAAPVIEAINAPSSVAPGEQFTVEIVASDPDAFTGRLQGQLEDTQGNKVDADVQIQVEDPLTYNLVDVDDAGFTIEQTSQPNVFNVTAPTA